MTAARFAALRARTVRDVAFRDRLCAGFVRTLQAEGLFDHLTPDQREDLRFVLLLQRALQTGRGHGIARAGASRAFSGRQLRALPQQPVSIDEWRARRAVNG